MAVNKNFVVKNGLEVNENLIVANATDSFVGVGTSTPNNTLHVFGGIGATDVRITGFSSFIQSVFVGASGTTFAVIDTPGSNPQVGIGTDIPAYLLDIRSAVSTGQTALYVQGDARITGDLIADDITLDQAEFTNIKVTGFTTTGELVVGMGASVTGITTLGHLNRASAGSGGTSVTFNPAAGIATNLQVIGNTYIEGDLKIQSDLEVDADLFIVGIITAGTVHVGSAFSSAGISTFMSDVYIGGKVQSGLEIAGVTTTASSGGITTTGGDLFVGNNLFIKDDITVDTNLNILGIATIGILTVTTDANVGSSLTVGGNVEIGGTINSLGGITTTGGDLYVGNNLFIKDDITVDTNLNILGVATVGVLSARDAVVSGASTVNGNFTVGGDATVIGDLNVTGDYSVDEISARNLDITGIATIHTLGVTSTTTTTDLSVGAAATVSGLFTAQDSLVSNASTITGTTNTTDLSVGAAATISGALNADGNITITNSSPSISLIDSNNDPDYIIGNSNGTFRVRNSQGAQDVFTILGTQSDFLGSVDVGSIIKMDATSGIITATTFKGVGEVLGIGSEGTPIGSGVSFIDFRSSTGTAFSCLPAVNGIATVTVTPGVSLGLAIALGG